MFDLQLALKPFRDPRILPKAGIIFGIHSISGILQYLINFTPYITDFIPSSLNPEQVANISSLVSLLGSVLISLLLFPATLYISGYTYMIADCLRKGSEEVLPEHDSIGDGIKIGGIAIGFSFLLSIPLIILLVLSFILLYGAIGSAGSIGGVMSFGLITGIIVFIFLVGIYFAALEIFIVPVFMYRYLTTQDFSGSFAFRPFVRILRQSWVDWIVVFGITLLLNMVTFGVQMILCCLGPFVTPFIDTVSVLAAAGLTGAVYNKLESVSDKVPVAAPQTSGSNSAG